LCCLRGVATLTGFGLAVEIGDRGRFTGSTIGAYLGLVPSESSTGTRRAQARSPRPATATPAGCWSRRPGLTAGPTGPAATSSDADSNSRRRCGRGPSRATGGCTGVGPASMPAYKRSTVSAVAVARELAGWCWSLAVLDDPGGPDSRPA
jgi:transposase